MLHRDPPLGAQEDPEDLVPLPRRPAGPGSPLSGQTGGPSSGKSGRPSLGKPWGKLLGNSGGPPGFPDLYLLQGTHLDCALSHDSSELVYWYAWGLEQELTQKTSLMNPVRLAN